ncbi:GntR family transcriptional regulator [Lutibaculum baratangense]|uniref:Transcriptional regulator, GntR family n=1 Tax=Lutibaculum baratangense AMV1 TaxID=631454 RepID=V4R0L2_9HYPH|nr:GntR family transcriptional regulator [Lutibaculum baratangense]ESR25527.1 transcriptional regulator, GntR family [Lutibaculum baratangense AMV1]
MGTEASRGEIAYQKLKQAIQDGTLPPGTRVREVEIADRLSISRTPAREAIRRLESEGLISFVPRHGAIISRLDHQQTMELYDLREVLEGTAAAFAARHASAAEIEELEEMVASEEAIRGDPHQLAELNRLFHSALYRAAHNRYLERSLINLRDSMALLGGTSLRVEGRYETAHAEHLETIQAVAARDPERADAAARRHIRHAQRARLKIMREELLGQREEDREDDAPGRA